MKCMLHDCDPEKIAGCCCSFLVALKLQKVSSIGGALRFIVTTKSKSLCRRENSHINMMLFNILEYLDALWLCLATSRCLA